MLVYLQQENDERPLHVLNNMPVGRRTVNLAFTIRGKLLFSFKFVIQFNGKKMLKNETLLWFSLSKVIQDHLLAWIMIRIMIMNNKAITKWQNQRF